MFNAHLTILSLLVFCYPCIVNAAPSDRVDVPEDILGVSVVTSQAFPSNVAPTSSFPTTTCPPPDHMRDDADVQALQKQYFLRYAERQVEILSEQRILLRNQKTASLVIFVVVHCAVLFGFLVSALEFMRSFRRRATEETALTEVKLAAEGIALKTSLHGTMLLALSLGFYFLYLKFVFPLELLNT